MCSWNGSGFHDYICRHNDYMLLTAQFTDAEFCVDIHDTALLLLATQISLYRKLWVSIRDPIMSLP